MFNLFKKDNPKETGSELAKQAQIHVALENGQITCFIIFVRGKPYSILKKFENTDLITSFVRTIEDRIKNKEYEDPRNAFMDDLIFDDNNLDYVLNVHRAVISNNQPIYKWQP